MPLRFSFIFPLMSFTLKFVIIHFSTSEPNPSYVVIIWQYILKAHNEMDLVYFFSVGITGVNGENEEVGSYHLPLGFRHLSHFLSYTSHFGAQRVAGVLGLQIIFHDSPL